MGKEKIQDINNSLHNDNKQTKKQKRRRFMQEVNWDDVNLLELGVLLDMAKDGYFFQIADGRIRSIVVKLIS